MENSLNDVRKAYRYLFEYQRKLIDSIQFLTSEYKIINAGPKFSGKPKFKSFKFKHWSWDYLPLYQSLFKFDIGAENNKSHYKELAVYVTSDTGHFINESEKSNNRIELSRFESTENSESVVILMICARNDFYNFSKRIALNNKMIKEDLITYSEVEKVIAKKYELTSFRNEESILALREDFKKYAISVDSNAIIFKK